MKRFLSEKLLTIVFLLIVAFIFPKGVYAENEIDGKPEGATGTYFDVNSNETIVPQITGDGNSYKKTYEIKANNTRPIYQYDELNLKIHVRRNLWSGDITLSNREYDTQKIELEVDLATDYNGINEADISMRMKLLKSGDLDCKVVLKDNGEQTIIVKIIGVQPFSDNFESEKRKSWGYSYNEAKVFNTNGDNATDTKVNGIIQGRYYGTNYDNSQSDKANEQVYSYEIKNDTGWSKYNFGEYETGITQREIEVEANAIIDYGRETHKGDKYICKYSFYYIGDKSKLIYKYSRERIQTANGESVIDITGQQSSEKFDDLSKEDKKTYRKYLASLDPTTSSSRQNVTFDDVLKNINGYVPGDTISGSDTQKITEKASLILSVITNIGIVLAVLMSAILGIKYMLGSLEEKAEYKKDLVPYLIGSILLFGICAIVKVLQTIGQSINNI